MIGIFVKAGDEDVGRMFDPYRKRLSEILKSTIRANVQSNDLPLILIEYHLEGRFLILPKIKVKVGRYRVKEHSISVVINVALNFKQMNESERKQFLANTMLEAINLLESKFAKQNFDSMNFSLVKEDVQKCVSVFLSD